MESKEMILEKNMVGVACDQREYDHGDFDSYYKEEVLKAMEEYKNSCLEELIKEIEEKVKNIHPKTSGKGAYIDCIMILKNKIQ